MRKNIIQSGVLLADGKTYIENDWFDGGIPGNISLAENVYIDTAYGFAGFHSLLPDAMTIGSGSGCYDRASFYVGLHGKIEIGEYNILNGSSFICNHHIIVGDHCMFAWGSLVTDSWIDKNNFSILSRRRLMQNLSENSLKLFPANSESKAVIIEDNVWVGFDAVILPGVRLGKGCIVGSKSIVTADIPSYAVAAGNPLKIIRYLDANDTEEAKERALKEFLSHPHI